MPHRVLWSLLLLAGLTGLRADPAAELTTALATFTGRDPVRAEVSLDYRHDNGDEPAAEPETATIALRVEAGRDGVKLTWPEALIEAVAEEQRRHAQDPNLPQGRRRALDRLGLTTIANYLNAAPDLARTLASAQFVGAVVEDWRGQPARKLTYKVAPPLSERERKYVKELDATATVWIAADGRPLGAERRVHMKGRALLVINFQSDERETDRFQTVGDRLVVVEHVKESSGSGGGQSGRERTAATLTVDRGTAL